MSRHHVCVSCGTVSAQPEHGPRFRRCHDCTESNRPYSLELARRVRTAVPAPNAREFGDYDPIAA
jgi:hypothetical protein